MAWVLVSRCNRIVSKHSSPSMELCSYVFRIEHMQAIILPSFDRGKPSRLLELDMPKLGRKLKEKKKERHDKIQINVFTVTEHELMHRTYSITMKILAGTPVLSHTQRQSHRSMEKQIAAKAIQRLPCHP